MALTYHSKKTFKEVEHFINEDEEHIFCRYYKPEKEIKGLLFFLHGYAEHCGRYAEVAKLANELNMLMFTHDHCGNGESEGKRNTGSFSYEAYVRDIIKHAEIMKEKYPDLPLYIYGHSMGGGLAVATVHKKPDICKGMILSAPLITASPETATPVKVFAVKLVGSLFPSLPVGELKRDHLSRDPEALKEYEEDPMTITSAMSAGTAKEYLKMIKDMSTMLPDINVPFFIGHGDDDGICDIGGSKLLHEVSKSEDKKLVVYPKMRHMLEHEVKEDTQQFLGDVKAWLSDHLKS